MNPEFKAKAIKSLVNDHSANIFNDDFWTSQDIIVNAVDNIKARMYVDAQCVGTANPCLSQEL